MTCIGTGKSYVGVALVLAYILIKEESLKLGHQLGPVLMLSYKNHALDEFLCDILDFASPKLATDKLIRSGKPENPQLIPYSEKNSKDEQEADRVLKERVDMLRRAQKIVREWRDCAVYLDTKSQASKVCMCTML